MLSLVSRTRSGRKELPVITEGYGKMARSAYSKKSGSTDKDLAMKIFRVLGTYS